MTGGGMGFIFAPEEKREAQECACSDIMAETKRELQHALPFAMEPVVYDFAINPRGTWAELLRGEEALLPAGYYALMVPTLLRRDPRTLSPLRHAELDRFGAACRAKPELSGMVQTLFDRLFPRANGRCRAGRVAKLLEENGFDRAQHEQIRPDLKNGRIGLAQNRLPANTNIEDVRPEDVTVFESLSSNDLTAEQKRWRERGLAALKAGEAAVVTLAAGAGSRWTQGAGVVKALHPFCKLAGRHRTFIETHLAKSRRAARLSNTSIPHVFTTSYLTHDPTDRYLSRERNYNYEGPVLLSAGKAIGLRRSATTVDAEVLAAAPKLKIVARAGVGLDNVDVDAATARGVLVVNAPTSNIHSAAEHAVALLLAAARQIAPADASLREHTWKRSSFSGTELYGKTVGVVGLGRIGQLVAQRLAAFGTHVVAYDPYVSAARAAQLGIELLTLDELLGRADFISVHLPKTPETAGLIGKEALAKTKPGVIIVNAARGGLVDEEALAEAIRSGHVRGAGIDVFAKEPATESPLFDLPQVVVTPHLGASTAEAQDRAGTDVAASVRLALAGEFVPDAVNVGGGVVGEEVAPWLDLVRKLGLLVGVLSTELPVSLSVQVRGELASEDVAGTATFGAARVVLRGHRGPGDIRQRARTGRRTRCAADISTASESPNHRSVVDVRAVYSDGSVANVSGALSGPQQVEKIVQINGRNFDLRAEGVYLIINYIDQPGTLGKIGTLLGGADINIHAAQLSEDAEGPGATILLRIDRDVPDDVRAAIAESVGAKLLEVVDLS